MGACEGDEVGDAVGPFVGVLLGAVLGEFDGAGVGEVDGASVGDTVGALVGPTVWTNTGATFCQANVGAGLGGAVTKSHVIRINEYVNAPSNTAHRLSTLSGNFALLRAAAT